jgi:hypothetical protein
VVESVVRGLWRWYHWLKVCRFAILAETWTERVLRCRCGWWNRMVAGPIMERRMGWYHQAKSERRTKGGTVRCLAVLWPDAEEREAVT